MIDKVIGFLSEATGIEKEKITPDSVLLELGMDSLKLLTVILNFEKEFGIKISNRQLGELYTVNDILKLLEK